MIFVNLIRLLFKHPLFLSAYSLSLLLPNSYTFAKKKKFLGGPEYGWLSWTLYIDHANGVLPMVIWSVLKQ